ncbi:MAG: murein biosynthesis integral membrane protein MurJ [Bacillaceae bacterium]|nr:murein biosynthesis integral membrane protein MurJ [Bacillaceae bacterium]
MRFLKILGAVAVINVLARLFGFFREVVIGYQYGTSYVADSIITAFTIPNFMYIVLGGAVTTAFISVYSKLSQNRQRLFSHHVFTLLVLVMGSVTILFMVFPGFWMNLFFSGLSVESETLTKQLFVWMAPSGLLLVIAMWLSGVLNVHERFNITAFSTLLFNFSFVAIAVIFTPLMDAFSYGLGATAGAFLMAMMLWSVIRSQKITTLQFHWGALPESKRFVKLALPILFGGATLQFYLFIQRIFAAQLSEGGVISSLNYASKMTQFPQAVLMTSVTTVIYPLLAKAAAAEEYEKMQRIYQQGIRLLSLLLLPVTIFVFIYAREIIEVIFEYGSFTESSTERTYPLLQIFALAMFGLAVNVYITRFFYAMENSYIPVIANVLSVFGVNIAVIALFMDTMGARAIAWGTVAGAIVNVIILAILAQKYYRLSFLNRRQFMSIVGLLAVTGMAIWMSSWLPAENGFVRLIFGVFAWIISMGAGIWLLPFKEERTFIQKKLLKGRGTS